MAINTSQLQKTIFQQMYDHPQAFETIEHLKQFWPWTMSVSGLAKRLAWETDNVLGLSKTTLIKNAIKLGVEGEKNGLSLEKMFDQIYTDLYASETNPKGLLSATEVQRKMRFFSEDFLNKEFDAFMSLLPSETKNQFLSKAFNTKINAQKWNYFGNSDDFTFSTKTTYVMQIDGLLYSHTDKTIVGVELKIDADFVKSKETKNIEQIVKYCNLFDTLLQNEQVQVDNFNILIISSKTYDTSFLLQESLDLLSNDLYLNKINRFDKQKSERIKKILSKLTIASITWQDFGESFEKLRDVSDGNTAFLEMYQKLVDGFLYSLSKKISKKTGKALYVPKIKIGD